MKLYNFQILLFKIEQKKNSKNGKYHFIYQNK